jgi:Phosphotransferase enzyme family
MAGTRPEAPDPALLVEAGESLAGAHLDGPAESIRWDVEERMERPRSTVFRLLATSRSGSSASAFYKEEQPSRGLPADFVRAGLARTKELTARLAAVSVPRGIRPAPVLAVDPQRLISVCLAVEGSSPPGPVWGSMVPGRWRHLLDCYRRVGEAVRLIEGLRVQDSDQIHDPRWVWEGAVDGAASYLTDEQMVALRRNLRDLVEELVAEGDVVYTHGDLSPSNVLAADDHIGIIDFHWTPRYRGYDLAVMAYRLEYAGLVPIGRSAALVDALVEGYGDRDIRRSAGWRYYLLIRQLGLAARGARASWRSRRASDRVREVVPGEGNDIG